MEYRPLFEYCPQTINNSSSEESSMGGYDFQDQPREQGPLVWMTTNIGNRRPFFNLYPFHLDYSKGGKNYWKCDMCKDGCKARLHTIIGTNEFLRFIQHSPYQAHNHNVDPISLPLAQVKSSLKEMSSERVKSMSNLEAYMSTSDFTKPIRERRRRARMNLCLDELKELIIRGNLSQSAKLEKADVLEMAVIRMSELQQENTRLLQQVQHFSQIKNEQAYLDAVQEGLSVFTTATSDALLRMAMPVPLNAAEYRQMLHDEVIGRLNTHICGQLNLSQNQSIDYSRSLPSFSGNIPESQNTTPVSFSAGSGSFHCTPEPVIPQLPVQTQLPSHISPSDLPYDNMSSHLSQTSQAQPTTRFLSDSSTNPISNQDPYQQTSHGSFFIGGTTYAPVPMPMIPAQLGANVANNYLSYVRHNNNPQVVCPSKHNGVGASNLPTPNDHSWISRQILERKAVELSSMQKLMKKKQRKSTIKSSTKMTKRPQKLRANCKCRST